MALDFKFDTHTHTYASGHAYNTMNEMAFAAKERGLQMLAITDHAPAMKGSATKMHFMNLRACRKEKYGIRLLHGAELNIIDFEGTVDLEEEILRQMDLCIASLHIPCRKPGTREENTRAYLSVMKNKYIHIIGHPDDGRYSVDYEKLVMSAKKYHVLLEVNNSSLLPSSFRPGADENYRKMLTLCKQEKVPVVLGSDAHVEEEVGNFTNAGALLEELEFPEELIMNTDLEKFKNFLDWKRLSW